MKEEVNNTLNDTLINILTETAKTVGDAKDFVLSELPDVVQQLLLWKFAESMVYFILSIVIFTTMILYWKYIYKNREAEWFYSPSRISPDLTSIGYIHIVVGGTLSLVGIVVGLCFMNIEWLQIWLAPKVYLIEYTAQLIR